MANDSFDENLPEIIKRAKLNTDNIEKHVTNLKNEDYWVRCDAVAALLKIGDERVVEPLIEIIKDLPAIMKEPRLPAIIKRAKFNKDDIDKHVSDLYYEHKDDRIDAIMALLNIGDERVVEPLIEVLKDEEYRYKNNHSEWEPQMCLMIIEALGEIGDLRAVQPLIKMLKFARTRPELEEGQQTRWHAAMALGEIGDSRAVGPLVEVLEDEGEDEEVLVYASEALEMIGEERAVEPLSEVQKDEGVSLNAMRSPFEKDRS